MWKLLIFYPFLLFPSVLTGTGHEKHKAPMSSSSSPTTSTETGHDHLHLLAVAAAALQQVQPENTITEQNQPMDMDLAHSSSRNIDTAGTVDAPAFETTHSIPHNVQIDHPDQAGISHRPETDKKGKGKEVSEQAEHQKLPEAKHGTSQVPEEDPENVEKRNKRRKLQEVEAVQAPEAAKLLKDALEELKKHSQQKRKVQEVQAVHPSEVIPDPHDQQEQLQLPHELQPHERRQQLEQLELDRIQTEQEMKRLQLELKQHEREIQQIHQVLHSNQRQTEQVQAGSSSETESDQPNPQDQEVLDHHLPQSFIEFLTHSSPDRAVQQPSGAVVTRQTSMGPSRIQPETSIAPAHNRAVPEHSATEMELSRTHEAIPFAPAHNLAVYEPPTAPFFPFGPPSSPASTSSQQAYGRAVQQDLSRQHAQLLFGRSQSSRVQDGAGPSRPRPSVPFLQTAEGVRLEQYLARHGSRRGRPISQRDLRELEQHLAKNVSDFNELPPDRQGNLLTLMSVAEYYHDYPPGANPTQQQQRPGGLPQFPASGQSSLSAQQQQAVHLLTFAQRFARIFPNNPNSAGINPQTNFTYSHPILAQLARQFSEQTAGPSNAQRRRRLREEREETERVQLEQQRREHGERGRRDERGKQPAREDASGHKRRREG